MNSMEISDILWEVDQLIVENQQILGDKKDLTDEEQTKLKKNREKINELFRRIEDDE